MVDVMDGYISPDLEKVNRAMNKKSLGRIGKIAKRKKQKKGGKNAAKTK